MGDLNRLLLIMVPLSVVITLGRILVGPGVKESTKKPGIRQLTSLH